MIKVFGMLSSSTANGATEMSKHHHKHLPIESDFRKQFENDQYPGMTIREARLAFDRYVARIEGKLS